MGTVSKIPDKIQQDKRAKGTGSPLAPLKKRLYSISEAASYLGRSVWSIRELIWKGSLPCVREGRRIHLDIIDLDQWIEKRKAKTFL
jgi:excisionase family DNA binding protein